MCCLRVPKYSWYTNVSSFIYHKQLTSEGLMFGQLEVDVLTLCAALCFVHGGSVELTCADMRRSTVSHSRAGQERAQVQDGVSHLISSAWTAQYTDVWDLKLPQSIDISRVCQHFVDVSCWQVSVGPKLTSKIRKGKIKLIGLK